MSTSDDLRAIAAHLLTVANELDIPPVHRPPGGSDEDNLAVEPLDTPPVHRPGGSGN